MADVRKVTIYLSFNEKDRLRAIAEKLNHAGVADVFHKNGRVNRSAVIGWLIREAKLPS